MSARKVAIVIITKLIVLVCYLVFLGLVGAAFAIELSAIFSLNPFAIIGGEGIFLIVVALDLFILKILDKPSPVMLAFSSPFIVAYIALHQAVSSQAIRRLIRQLENVMQSPIIRIHF